MLYELPLYQRYINSTLSLVPGLSAGGYAYGGTWIPITLQASAAAQSVFSKTA